MFSHLHRTRKVDLGEGAYAVIATEPTMGLLRLGRRFAAEADSMTGVEDAGFVIAMIVERWVGDDVPTSAEGGGWPDLDGDDDITTRRESLDGLPRSAFEHLAKECRASLFPTEDEAKNSEAPPE